MSTVSALLTMRCPKCHEGKLFIKSNPYNLKMLSKMPEKCAVCGQLTEPEPAFYYGAMYCSYFICVGLCFLNFVLLEIVLGFSGVVFLILNGLILILFWPIIFRYARVCYIYMFVRYDPSFIKKERN